jgi:hypothetical protein
MPSALPRRGRGAPALHPLHLGLDGQAQGRAPHHRRLHGGCTSPASTSSICGTRTSTGAPPTSAGSPATATSSTARSQRRDLPHVRGRPELPRPGALLAHHRAHRVSILYTAPTAIRAFMRWGEQWPMKTTSASLRLLGTVGEPINPEAWMWYQRAHRRRALPHRRHVVADRDGRDHDDAAARRRPTKPGSARSPSSA